MNQQDHQPLQHSKSSTSSRQQPPIQAAYTPQEACDLLRKLQETTVRLNASQACSKGTSPDDKNNAYDQYAIFDGLLPRIETRGQSKHSSKKSSGKKKEVKSSGQQYVPPTDSQDAGTDTGAGAGADGSKNS
ncbi:hypothetical protein CH063_15497 [Colletotrichum higginsianum]|uniref:Uncharacterized protein n=1 Tax=Colletotrichum higginsianum (strain IMI 349063) TaxID=759273 RepID=H1W334_COLHI|nr:hypothetical protein CH063_15497 [Colletotrichum higginsianum]